MEDGTESAELRRRELGRGDRGEEIKIRTKAKRRTQEETETVIEIGGR